MFDVEGQFETIKNSALQTIKDAFPIEGNNHKLVLREVWIDDKLDVSDLPSQKDAKINGKTWAVPVLASIDLIDKSTNKVINSVQRMRLLDLPKLTPRASYIVDGNEYQVVNQLRLKPGVYTRIKNNGELESKVNLAKGINFDIILNQERGVFVIKIGTSNIKLYPILRDLGVSDARISDAWGPDLVASNAKASAGIMDTEIHKFRASFMKRPAENREQAIEDVKNYLDNTRIDPRTTKMTMGESFTVADADLILAASKRLLETARGEKEPDDRDSLVFKSLHSIDDFVQERLSLNEEKIRRIIMNKLDRKFKISEILSKKVFNDPIKTMFTQTALSAPTEQTNPLHMLSGQLKLTIMGEGGIQNEQAVSTGARSVHPSEIGFVDPVLTPQSGQVGAVTRLALGARKDGNQILTPVINVKTGKLETIDPIDFENSIIAFADQYKHAPDGTMIPIAKNVKVMKEGNKTGESPSSKVDYVIVDPISMFSVSTNLIPFLNSTQGNRALMAASQYEQALNLKYKEQPLVQVDTGLGATMEQMVGRALSHKSPVDGTVTKIDDNYIHIKGKDGKPYKVGLYKDFPLNQKTFLNAEPIVSVGDEVKAGDVVSDDNYTKDGVLSMGTNLRVAYVPYKGYNFEDGIVISETAAKKMTSEHMHKVNVQIAEGGVVDKKKFLAYFPTVISAASANKLDDDGVIREGETVEMGDTLIAYMVKSLQTPERMAIQKLHRSLLRPYMDRHEEWKYDFKGIVSNVIKGPKQVTVYVKTEEPATIGDKLSGRYGNKGIISLILPDGEMPHTEDGAPVEVLLNPIGIPSRLNPSQILETAAAKVADKTGETFKIRNFSSENNHAAVMEALGKEKISDKEILFDPEDGKPLGAPVMVGKQFMLKLDHPVRKKFSARSRGPYTLDLQPAPGSGESGQSMDQYTMYSMLAHGAKENLREMATYKSEKNDEFWRALLTGQPLPAPRPSYAFDKFLNLLKASGVNVEKNGNKFQLLPLTDAQVEEMSSGEIKNSLMLKGKNLAPETGGMFDPKVTGGIDGSNWGHINLTEPIPNPVFEGAIKTILDIKQSTYDDIITGKLYVDPKGQPSDANNGFTGGEAIRQMLGKIDIDSRLNELNTIAKTAKQNQLDKINKEIRYLKALKNNEISPEEYVITKVPVLPPKYRPIYPQPDGSLNTSDANFLYRDMSLVNQKLDELKSLPDSEKVDLRRDMYNSMKALVGLGNPITYKDYRGFIEIIKGRTQPKTGFFQKKLVKRRQELTGRSTIVPEPSLNVDEVGLPKKMIWKIYEPHIVRELVQRGYTPLDAQKQVQEQTPVAQRALEVATEKRPVLLNRAPSLHKFSVMAFKPQVTDGSTIKIHPLVVKGFNADFDGDCEFGIITLALKKDLVNSYKEVKTLNSIYYNMDKLKGAELTARFRETLPYCSDDYEIYFLDLGDMPHGNLLASKDGKNGLIDFYEAIPGTKVLAYNEETGEIDWKDVQNWSVHHNREIEIVTLNSGHQIITDDDPRAVYGVKAGSLDICRDTPSGAIAFRMLVPRMVRLNTPCDEMTEYDASPHKKETSQRHIIKETIPLDEEFGYFIGAVAGDGWADSNYPGSPKSINLASSSSEIKDRFKECTKHLLNESDIHSQERDRNYTGRHDSYGECTKLVIGGQELSSLVYSLVGKGSQNKHLPSFWFKAPEKFKFGLFAGLMDTDGSISISRTKNAPQLMASYYSTSLRLVNEVRLLAASIGIKGRITACKTPHGKDSWILSFSNCDISKWAGRYMVHPEKLAKLREIGEIKMTPNLARQDIVPISRDLLSTARSLHGAPRNADKEHKSLYVIMSRAIKDGFITRETAKKVLAIGGLRDHEDYNRFKAIVDNDSVTWDIVASIEKTGIRETGYDLTVPGYETFMNAEGVILSNTMVVHSPVTEKGRIEAFQMLPTNNIFDQSTGDIMLSPTNEMVLGLYLLTKEGTKLDKSFNNVSAAKQALDDDEITINSVINIGGQQTTLGRALVNDILPEPLRDPNIFLNKSGIKKILNEVARHDKSQFGRVVDALKNLGNKHVFKTGFTVGMEDISPVSDARKKADLAAKKILGKKPSEKQVVNAYDKAGTLLSNLMRDEIGNNDTSLFHMANSGAKGSWDQLRQIVAAPVLVQDHVGNVIPEPIMKSYAEGLDNAGYWSSMYGARAGTIGKSLQTSVPGYFQKRLVSSVMGATVTVDDCGTNNGVDESVDSKDALGRFLASGNPDYIGSKNEIVTSVMLAKLKARGIKTIKIRSPLTCESSEGICVKCFGRTEEGSTLDIGDNVGTLAATYMSEPLVQMAMNAFHTGGVAGAGEGTAAIAKGYDRISQLLEMPDIVKGKATLSSVDGTIDSIIKNPAGGHFITVSGEQHFVPQSREVVVKKGQKVSKGDYLSDGVAKPQELLEYKGMDVTRQYLADELQKAYSKPIKKNFFEAVVKEMTNVSQIIDPGKSDFDFGDYAPLNKIEDLNRQGQEISHSPILKGINTLPLVSEDWMARMATRDIAKTIREGASRGWTSDIHGTHPIPAYVYGAEFGIGTEGKY